MNEARSLSVLERRIASDPEDWDAVADWCRVASRTRALTDSPRPGPLGAEADWLGDLLTLGPYPREPEALLAWHTGSNALCRVSHRSFAPYDPDWKAAYQSDGEDLLAAGAASIARVVAWGVKGERAFAAAALHPRHARALIVGELGERLSSLIAAARAVHSQAPGGLLAGGMRIGDLRRDDDGLVIVDLARGAWGRLGLYAMAAMFPPPPRELVLLAPDRLAGRALDPRDDVYSFGQALFEVLAGRPPIEADSFVLVARKILAPQSERDWDWAPIPEPYRALCQRALARERADRFPDLGAFADALEELAA